MSTWSIGEPPDFGENPYADAYRILLNRARGESARHGFDEFHALMRVSLGKQPPLAQIEISSLMVRMAERHIDRANPLAIDLIHTLRFFTPRKHRKGRRPRRN